MSDLFVLLAVEMPVADALSNAVQTVVVAVLGLLGTVIVSLLTAGSRKLIAWLDAKAKESESNAHYAAFKCATSKLETLTKNAVIEVEHTLVREAKAQKTWGADAARKARDTAVGIVIRHLGPKGLQELEGCMGHATDVIEGIVRTLVERFVQDSRIDMKPNANGPVVSLGTTSGPTPISDGTE